MNAFTYIKFYYCNGVHAQSSWPSMALFCNTNTILWVKTWLPAEQNSDVKPLDDKLKYDCQAQSSRKFKTAIPGQ
jgi:hypothetical protein